MGRENAHHRLGAFLPTANVRRRSDLHPVGNADVSVDARGAAHHTVAADVRGTGNTRAGGHHRVLADVHVVTELNLVI